MKPNHIEEALKTLDISDIAFKLSQMALKVISGKEIKEKTYSVPFSVPEELAEVFELLAEKSGVPVEDMLSHLAKQSYESALKQIVNQQQPANHPPSPEQIKQTTGFDLNGLTQRMNQMQDLMSQLQQIQKVVQNVNEGKTEEDSIEPPLSTDKVHCPTGREE